MAPNDGRNIHPNQLKKLRIGDTVAVSIVPVTMEAE
jgi:hypothetical protein